MTSWVKLDTGFWENPKVWKAGLDGGIVFQLILCDNYRGKHQGTVPGVSEASLFMKLAAYGFTLERAQAALEACFESGLLERGSDGDIVIPGFDNWNGRPSVDPEDAHHAECGQCGRTFVPSRKGHTWCSEKCRYAAKARTADAASAPDQSAEESPRDEGAREDLASCPRTARQTPRVPASARERPPNPASARDGGLARGDPRDPRESQSQSQKVPDPDPDLNGGTTRYASTLAPLAHGQPPTRRLAATRPGPGHQPQASDGSAGGSEGLPPEVAALDNRMRVLGIFNGDERLQRAKALASEGMSVEDFDLLFTHAQFGKHPLRLLASFLRRGHYGWRDDLADATRRRGRLAPSKTERSA